MRSFSILVLVIGISFGSVKAVAQEYNFSNITDAFRTFLNDDLGLIAGDTEPRLGDFWHLSSYASNEVLKDPLNNFKIVHVCNYNQEGKEVPVIYQNFRLNNAGTTKEIFVEGYYFVTKVDNTTGKTQNLILNASRDEVVIYVSLEYQQLSVQVDQLLREYEVTKNPYRFAAIEITEYPDFPPRSVFAFKDNVANITSTWDDLILDSKLKETSFDLTEGFLGRASLYKDLGINMKKGILLAGPPGTGKSFLGEILINSVLHGSLKNKATIVVVSARNISVPGRIKLLFSGARRLSPTNIFMEDIDLLGIKNRQGGQGDFQTETKLNELLNGIDGLIDANHVLTIGTTNRIDYVDYALTRSMRMGQHLWYGLPTFFERQTFFNRFGVKMAVWAKDVDDVWLAALTEGMSGSDIIEIIRLAKKDAFLAGSWEGEKLLLTREFFLSAVALLKEEHSADGHGLRLSSSGLLGSSPRVFNYSFAKRALDQFDLQLKLRSQSKAK